MREGGYERKLLTCRHRCPMLPSDVPLSNGRCSCSGVQAGRIENVDVKIPLLFNYCSLACVVVVCGGGSGGENKGRGAGWGIHPSEFPAIGLDRFVSFCIQAHADEQITEFEDWATSFVRWQLFRAGMGLVGF